MTKFSDTQLKEQVESNEERGKLTNRVSELVISKLSLLTVKTWICSYCRTFNYQALSDSLLLCSIQACCFLCPVV